MDTTALRPYAARHGEGKTLSCFGSLTWVKASGAQTGGALALAEPAPASGFAPAGPLAMDRLLAEAAKVNIEILGPLPV